MMPTLKLARLPDRTPVKLTVHVLPDLHEALTAYAAVYAETYSEPATVEQLVPAMLSSFLDSDRGFHAARTQKIKASAG
jgi:hypothetical protein